MADPGVIAVTPVLPVAPVMVAVVEAPADPADGWGTMSNEPSGGAGGPGATGPVPLLAWPVPFVSSGGAATIRSSQTAPTGSLVSIFGRMTSLVMVRLAFMRRMV